MSADQKSTVCLHLTGCISADQKCISWLEVSCLFTFWPKVHQLTRSKQTADWKCIIWLEVNKLLIRGVPKCSHSPKRGWQNIHVCLQKGKEGQKSQKKGYVVCVYPLMKNEKIHCSLTKIITIKKIRKKWGKEHEKRKLRKMNTKEHTIREGIRNLIWYWGILH